MFNEGGLEQDGGSVDPVSGNDVPIGSSKEEVRDDIDAKLSEGEFVFPADVVRFIGLNNLMQIRQEAKAGLKKMEAMGQMGNSDEATLPDNTPFMAQAGGVAGVNNASVTNGTCNSGGGGGGSGNGPTGTGGNGGSGIVYIRYKFQ